MIWRMAVIYIAVLNVGFDMSVGNTTLGMASFRKYFGYYDEAAEAYKIKSIYQSAWMGGTSAGQIIMDIPGGWLADRYGRKFTLTLSVVFIIIASTIQITAHSIAQIIAGKTVFGMGVGLYISFCTSYTAELASPRLRGIACMAVNLCIQGGMWVGGGAALGLSNNYPDIDDERAFRYIFALQYLFAGIYLLLVYWLPESPNFYINKEQYEEAEKIIASLYGKDYDTKRHLNFLIRTNEEEKQIRNVGKSISYRELFKGRNRIRMLISACIIWPLFMGTAFWPNYQTYYFELAGAKNPQAMNYGATSVAIGTSMIAWFLVESVGRRKLWLFGAAGMTISNLIGGFMYIPFSSGNKAVAGRVATAFVFIWNGFYDIGPANMGYAITSEVPSSRMRVRNNALVHVFSHATNLVISFVVPYLFNDEPGSAGLLMRMGYIWAAFGILFTVWGWFFIPNVAGLNAYEIDQLFESKCPPRKFDNAKFDELDNLIPSSVLKNVPADLQRSA
ncbi:general substrate transporter [Sarocladium strictum]